MAYFATEWLDVLTEAQDDDLSAQAVEERSKPREGLEKMMSSRREHCASDMRQRRRAHASAHYLAPPARNRRSIRKHAATVPFFLVHRVFSRPQLHCSPIPVYRLPSAAGVPWHECVQKRKASACPSNCFEALLLCECLDACIRHVWCTE